VPGDLIGHPLRVKRLEAVVGGGQGAIDQVGVGPGRPAESNPWPTTVGDSAPTAQPNSTATAMIASW
jgi:hypothetical protein